jgi:imidazolonepropionase-like amidohydrolase
VSVTLGSNPLNQVILGKLVTPDQIIDGQLVIEGETITCLAATCEKPVGATVFHIGDAFVYPGLIDAHNHVAYNVLPKWNTP